ncbi:PH domain-containing protein [Thermophilibacter provencensis]|uniref:PH domain-containing protein n=1 Tax=Thermophilibacter provencensis TaxID=1852386 RepID=UPI00094A9FED|nr:PH domain-containing protein [Thermophilibacter provencensis]
MGEKNVRPERMFPGRTDPWFIAVMAIVAGGLSVRCVACFAGSGPSSPWGWLALLPVPAFVALAALPIRSNRVELYGDRLVVVYAGTRSSIPYARVRGVSRTRTLWAGTANSLDRVYIEAPQDGDAIVSVTDNDALVAELERRCGLGPGA